MQKQAKQVKSRYTQAFKEEAVRLVLDKGQSMTSKTKQTGRYAWCAKYWAVVIDLFSPLAVKTPRPRPA
jgi:transposase-like protein